MGRTPIPCTIWIDPIYMTQPTVMEWAEKGHIIQPITGSMDIIMHPKAWRFLPQMWDGPYAEIALKAAREIAQMEKKGRK